MLDMEIYRNSEPTVEIDVPLATANYAVDLVLNDGGRQSLSSNSTVDQENQSISITIPFEHTQFDGVVTLEITMMRQDGGGSNATFTEYVKVVTPLFTWKDLPRDFNRDEVAELESLVRTVVEAKTGQVFGKRKMSHQASTASSVINFNAPLIRFTGVSDRYLTDTTTLNPPKIPYEVFDEGYSMAVDWKNYDIKTDSFWLTSSNKCRNLYIYGDFGYDSVPEDVKRAALLIAGMWGSQQAVWRDRFVATIRSSDWNVTYSEKGFDFTTGSVTADMLLSKYTRRYHPAVI